MIVCITYQGTDAYNILHKERYQSASSFALFSFVSLFVFRENTLTPKNFLCDQGDLIVEKSVIIQHWPSSKPTIARSRRQSEFHGP